MITSEMWVFIWDATEDHNSFGEVYSDFESAWERFGNMRVKSFPHYIQRIEFNSNNEPEVTFFNWSQFIDLHVQEVMNG